jgi:outer membrane biogenesis lipoprotein LolB
VSGLARPAAIRWRASSLVCAFVCVLTLAGCASLAPTRAPDANNAVTTSNRAKAVDRFTVSGRFAAKRGDEQGNGQFRFEQKGTMRTLDLFSPTATQVARIEANASSARATLANGEQREAATLSELLKQFIDIPLTDAEFSSWLQGIPRGATPSLAADNTIESFRESGWSIVISSRFDGDAKFVRRMRWSFDAGGNAAENAQITWVFDEFSTQ